MNLLSIFEAIMRPVFFIFLLLLLPLHAKAGEIDRIAETYLAGKGIPASGRSDAARLARRYYLTVTDRIPTVEQAEAFIKNPDREALVDSLLASDGFVRKLVLKWGDLLRIKSEFPSCMWPNAVQAFNKWLTEEFRANTPYDEFVRHLLVCSGSNFRVPQTNFYRAGSDRTAAKFTSDVALLFLGQRSAPAEWLPFFCQVKFKSSKEWKEEILCLDIDAVPDSFKQTLGSDSVTLQPDTDFRIPFAEWLTSRNNRDFARAFANRFWFWMTGCAIIDPVDDIAGREPSCPALLDYLTDSFIASGFNVRSLAREILLSDVFCRSTLSVPGNISDRSGLSHFRQTRITAEQLCDAICDITEVHDLYSSRAPEPFTNFPPGTHINEVCDGTITTPQLDIFGRPSRDMALENSRDNSVNAKQILYLLNSTTIQDKLTKSPYLKSLNIYALRSTIDTIYLRVLSRHASREETDAFLKWTSTTGEDGRKNIESLVWALLNTDEFLFLN